MFVSWTSPRQTRQQSGAVDSMDFHFKVISDSSRRLQFIGDALYLCKGVVNHRLVLNLYPIQQDRPGPSSSKRQ
jgi:hypothetical protein